MTDSNDKYDARRLYRHYQETRDNISPSVLNALRQKLEQERHEDSIYAITQMAKVASGSDQKTEIRSTKPSWFAGIVSKFSRVSPQLGMAVACLAIVAVILPMSLDLNNNRTGLSAASHLSDCVKCASYIANASVNTRGTISRSLSSEQRLSARLGKLSGKLKVLATSSPNDAVIIGLTDLNKLPVSALSQELIAVKGMVEPNLSDLNDALRNSSVNQDTFNASEALFIANVTARRTIDTRNAEGFNQSILNALVSFESIKDLNLEQRRRISQLRPYLEGKAADQSLIKTIEFASGSLGG